MTWFTPPSHSSGIGLDISSEPIIDTIFKKPKLGTACTGESTLVSASPGITCSMYPATKAASTNPEIESFKDVKKINKNLASVCT